MELHCQVNICQNIDLNTQSSQHKIYTEYYFQYSILSISYVVCGKYSRRILGKYLIGILLTNILTSTTTYYGRLSLRYLCNSNNNNNNKKTQCRIICNNFTSLVLHILMQIVKSRNPVASELRRQGGVWLI